MRTHVSHLNTVVPYAHRDQLMHAVARTLPQIGTRLEAGAMFLLLAAFWGLIVFLAMTSAL